MTSNDTSSTNTAQAEAERRARELNAELGEQGAPGFYVAEEIRPGQWEPVRHKDRPRLWERLLDFLAG